MNRFATLASVMLVGTSLIGPDAVQAQDASTLRQAWQNGNGGFVYLSWLRVEDRGELYSSAIYTELNDNTLSIYNTYKVNVFGKITRCGGLGCDLAKGGLVATLQFERQGRRFVVTAASGQGSFLQGAKCQIVAERFSSYLECRSNKAPNSSVIPSIIRFAPGP